MDHHSSSIADAKAAIRREALACRDGLHAPIELGLSESTPRYSADQVEVRFADTGEGIQEDALDRIFIPFYTTKTKGTGLGLAISQRIVKGHGGTIEVQSRVGEGTEFILRFASATALDTAGRLGMVQTPASVEAAAMAETADKVPA